MRLNSRIHIVAAVVIAGGIAACSNDATAPRVSASSVAANDRSPARPEPSRPDPRRPDPVRPDTAKPKPCRPDTGLTQSQIEAIRAAYDAYQNAIAEDLRLIAEVEHAAREAAQAGARREEIAAILARADAAKRHIAEATERLRAAIEAITHDGRVPCSIVLGVQDQGR